MPLVVLSPSKLCHCPIAMQVSVGSFPQLESDSNEASTSAPIASNSKSKTHHYSKRALVISSPVVESKSSPSSEVAFKEAAVITLPPLSYPVLVSYSKCVLICPLPMYSSPKAPFYKKTCVISPGPEKLFKATSGEFYSFSYFSLLIFSYFYSLGHLLVWPIV